MIQGKIPKISTNPPHPVCQQGGLHVYEYFTGYLVALVTLSFIALCEVAWHVFSTQIAYNVNLAAVSLVALGCTVQQSSFYGFAALLPKKKFTQALMTGESVAGLLVSSNR